MQGMVAGKRSGGKPRQISWEKDITYTFGTMTKAITVAEREDMHRFHKEICAATS